MLAVEMEITAEFYSVSKQVTFVSTNDIFRLNKCHKVSPIVLAVSRDNHELLICPVSVTACGCYSATHSHTTYIRISAGVRDFSKNEVRSIVTTTVTGGWVRYLPAFNASSILVWTCSAVRPVAGTAPAINSLTVPSS